MNSLINKACLTLILFFGVSSVWADLAPDMMEKLQADSRPQEDKARDGSRRPYQVMQALGVSEGMTVIDIGAGRGWYTHVLSAAVGPTGRVISQFGPRALQRNNGQGARDMAAAMDNTEVSFVNLADLGSNVADAAITALNIHHSNDERGIPYMRDIYTVLKPGGVAAIIDHIGLPGKDNASMHRMLVSDAKRWIEAAGLEVVEESDLLRTNADDHERTVRDPIYGRDVDRFLLIVRKPG